MSETALQSPKLCAPCHQMKFLKHLLQRQVPMLVWCASYAIFGDLSHCLKWVLLCSTATLFEQRMSEVRLRNTKPVCRYQERDSRKMLRQNSEKHMRYCCCNCLVHWSNHLHTWMCEHAGTCVAYTWLCACRTHIYACVLAHTLFFCEWDLILATTVSYLSLTLKRIWFRSHHLAASVRIATS